VYRTRHCQRIQGFTLLELLIALAISLTLIAAFLVVLQRCRDDFSANESVARLQDAGRQAMAVIARDLEHAGFFGFGPPVGVRLASALPAGARDCGPDFAVQLGQPITGSDNGYRLAAGATDCAPTGSAGGASASADTLTTRRASLERASPRVGRLQVYSSALASTGSLVLFADGRAPGPVDDTHEVRDLEVRTYYIANHSVDRPGWPALRVKVLTESRAAAQFRDEEVMPGVEDLQVELRVLHDEEGARTLRNVPVDSELARSGQVIAAQVWLRLRADITEPGYRNEDPLHYSNVTFVPDAAQSAHRRLLMQRSVSLRNLSTP
jgi:prepilin-type N-terminal cleavage/methylation domain-containing protein